MYKSINPRISKTEIETLLDEEQEFSLIKRNLQILITEEQKILNDADLPIMNSLLEFP